MSRNLFWKAFLQVRGLHPYLDQLERFSRLGEEEARRDLGSRLLAQLHYFGQRSDALPEWRDAIRIRDPDELWSIWPTLPVITKDDLQTRFEARSLQERYGIQGMISSTGGSTGQPTSYLHDTRTLRAAAAGRYFVRRQLGWRPGMATVGVWGSERDIGHQRSLRNRVSGWLRNDWLVDGYRLDDRTVDSVLNHLARHRRIALYGFTSMLEFVARGILERGGRLPGQVCAAWNGGEMLYPHQAEVFQRAFGLPLRNLYGGREFGPLAYQNSLDGPLQVLRPWVFVEVVDEQNRPVRPYESGRLLWTSTLCRGTPFLRYEIGDLGSVASDGQDESGVRSLSGLQGRTAGLLRLPGGRTINCLFWNHLFKDFREVKQFQVVLQRDSHLLLRLQGVPWANDREGHLRTLLRNLVGEIPVRVDWVDRIPRTSQGKLVQVICES